MNFFEDMERCQAAARDRLWERVGTFLLFLLAISPIIAVVFLALFFKLIRWILTSFRMKRGKKNDMSKMSLANIM